MTRRAAPETDRFRTLGNRVSWLVVPYVAVAQFATLGTPIVKLVYPAVGITWLTYETVALLLLAGISVPWLLRRRRELDRAAGVAMLAFTALILYAVVSAIVRPDPHVQINEEHWDVPTPFLVAPLVTAWLAMVAGVGLVLAAERSRRLRVLTVAAAAAIVCAFAAWPIHAAATRSIRFSTGQGGAAVVHVMLLLVAAVGVACLLRAADRRTQAFCAVLVAGALIGIVATQSRGALITLGVWLVLLLLGRVTGSIGMRRWWPLVVGAGVVAVVAPLIPGASRVLSLADPQRLSNLEVSLKLWLADPATVVFGTGPGGVWPWHFFESMKVHPKHYETSMGSVLGTPHSTPLAALVELGVVGAILLAAVLVAVALLAFGARTPSARWAVAAALLATLVAFLFDTYLLRNFGIAVWWWAAVALIATWPPAPLTRATSEE
ncbi:MAG: O-antigen ligase family protein [Tessaracoccus sp.]|uniref:O-antigen ligase family protein n=1 Tax=Tessaracoccus sp. TaxID=1971211 RepID=UPI001EC1430E|nr:O-antigen ligase family protein [Tessaracoccus sp.]MBK7820127.1 O-antigen ligase family protein [Tessaracoccus sp.]